MATDKEYIEYILERIYGAGDIRYRKMFGEYMVYVNNKPLLLVCDNTVFVKVTPCIEPMMLEAAKGFPYQGAKLHYILDIDNTELSLAVIKRLEEVTAIPRKRNNMQE